MKHTYTKTLQTLAERRAAHEKAICLIDEAQKALELGEDILFQVHYQANDPSNSSVMAEGKDIASTMQEARRLAKEYDPFNKRGGPPELFVRIGDILIAVEIDDATVLAIKATNTIGKKFFTLDDRVLNTDRVFRVGEKLPSGWYATVPTREREEAAVPA